MAMALLGSLVVDRSSVFLRTQSLPLRIKTRQMNFHCCTDLTSNHSAAFLPISALEVSGPTQLFSLVSFCSLRLLKSWVESHDQGLSLLCQQKAAKAKCCTLLQIACKSGFHKLNSNNSGEKKSLRGGAVVTQYPHKDYKGIPKQVFYSHRCNYTVIFIWLLRVYQMIGGA